METRRNVVLRGARHLHGLDDARTTERSGSSFKRFPTTPSFNTGSTTSASKLNLIKYVSWHGTKGQSIGGAYVAHKIAERPRIR